MGHGLPPVCFSILIALAALGCGAESLPTSPGPSPTIPLVSTVMVDSPTPVACPGDLAEEGADVVIFGAQEGDFLTDRLSLASGDFNADGFADALINAPLADGPANDRDDAGEAYNILSR